MIFENFAIFLGKIMAFSAFVSTANGFPKPLLPQEEKELFTRFKNGDMEAKNKLINHNLRLVTHIVKKFSTAGEADDLISVGTIGLIKGINTYEEGKGSQLSTYAARCIENEILMLLRTSKKHRQVSSLQETLGTDKDGNEIELMDIIASMDEELEDIVAKGMLQDKIEKIISENLNEREQEIIKLRYGIGGNSALPQREVAIKLGISRSYISRLEKKALEIIQEKVKEINIQ
ncbi:MAG: RNA polymerase sporulation sigma factor SigK [Clostridia bacterium]